MTEPQEFLLLPLTAPEDEKVDHDQPGTQISRAPLSSPLSVPPVPSLNPKLQEGWLDCLFQMFKS